MDKKIDLTKEGQSIALQSIAGSGAEVLSSLIEEITRVFVGSDSDSQSVFDHVVGGGHLGLGHTSASSRVWFTKTSFPLEKRRQTFSAQKMIVVVRNPACVIQNSADRKNLLGCNDRLAVDDDYSSKFADWWSKWVPKQVENISQAHSFITSNVAGKVPTFYVRYEDLVSQPASILTDLFKFVLDADSL